MFQNLDVFKTAISMARHAGVKQALTSQNVANADTPGYRAQAITPFKDLLPNSFGSVELRATRPEHFAQWNTWDSSVVSTASATDPNGNSVVLEDEILSSVDAKRQHDRALAVYRASLGILRSALSKQ